MWYKGLIFLLHVYVQLNKIALELILQYVKLCVFFMAHIITREIVLTFEGSVNLFIVPLGYYCGMRCLVQ